MDPNGDPTANVVLNPDGSIDVQPGTPSGTYTVEYQICEVNNPTNCDTAIASVTIDDPIISDVTDTSELEGTNLIHTVTLNVASSSDEMFTFSITDNTTDRATDYTFPPTFSNGVIFDEIAGTITVPAGVTSFTVTTPTTDDLLDEDDESYNLTVGTETPIGTDRR